MEESTTTWAAQDVGRDYRGLRRGARKMFAVARIGETRYGASMTLESLLKSLHVARDGWMSREAFTRLLGVAAGNLAPSRAGEPVQRAIAFACWLAIEIEAGRVPVPWALVPADVQRWALAIVRARLGGGLDQLGDRLVAWGLAREDEGERMALALLDTHGEALAAALDVQGWGGVVVLLRGLVDG